MKKRGPLEATVSHATLLNLCQTGKKLITKAERSAESTALGENEFIAVRRQNKRKGTSKIKAQNVRGTTASRRGVRIQSGQGIQTEPLSERIKERVATVASVDQ